jgi:transcription elongation factor Elf1
MIPEFVTGILQSIRKTVNENDVACKECGGLYDADALENGLCPDCYSDWCVDMAEAHDDCRKER